MHLILCCGSLVLAWGLRLISHRCELDAWHLRWQRTMTLFLLPPLILVTTAIAVIWMGPQGAMVGVWEGWVTYFLALAGVGFALYKLLQLTGEGWHTLDRIRIYPRGDVNGYPVRLLDLPHPYSAQIGFWQPELVISQGLLTTLTPEHLAAVLAHERAHYYYRDTFCFFWWGWVRQITAWLPATEILWQELLMLREIRADRWASAQTDPLLVAEAILQVVREFPLFTDNVCAPLGQMTCTHRLTQRIEALLASPEPIERLDFWSWAWFAIALLPLCTVPFHHG
jgi:Zn-dependent protease with chaperone function